MKLESYIDNNKDKKAKNYSPNKKSKTGTISFLIIVVISSIFWGISYLQSKLTMTIKIPIEYQQITTKYQAKQDLPQFIVVEIKDKVINILRNRKNIKYKPKEQKIGDIYKIIFDEKSIKDFVLKNIPSSSEIISISPSKQEIPLTLKYSRVVPIKKDLNLSLRNGYVMCSTKLSKESITIYGDKETIKNIDSIPIEIPKRKDIYKNLDLYAKVVLPKGVTSSTDSIKVNADIEIISQMDITLPINVVGVPSGIIFHTLPSNAKVSISMPISKLKELKNNKDFPLESQIVIGIIYNDDLKLSDNNSIDVKLIEKPQWIMDYTINPSKVQYIIEKLHG